MTNTPAPTVTPFRSEQPPGRNGFLQLVRAEWTKFRTVRMWMVTLVIAALVVVGLTYFGAQGNHSGYCIGNASSAPTCVTGHPPVPVDPSGQAVTDSYTFVDQPLTGDGTVTVRVGSLSETHSTGNAVRATSNGASLSGLSTGVTPWAKAGLLIENDPTPGASYAAVMVTGSHGVRMQYDYTHDTAGLPGPVTAASPRWLRLARQGDLVTGYDSTDGTHWTEIGTARLPGLAAAVKVGLFVTSPVYFAAGSENGTPSLATASFDGLTVRGDVPDHSWAGQEIGTNSLYPTMSGSWHQDAAAAFTVSGSGDIAPLVGGGASGAGSGSTALIVGGLAGIIVLMVLATLFITSEYRRGLIRTTLTASPRRDRVLAAKAVVVGSVTFVAGLVGAAVGEPLARHVLVANGNYLFPLSGLSEVRVVVGTALLLAVASVLALGLGVILRRSAGAVAAAIVVLVLPFILATTLPPGPSNWLMRLTPTAAFAIQGTEPHSALVTGAYTLINGYYPLGPWAGFGVLCVYAAVALGAAMWLLRRRDV